MGDTIRQDLELALEQGVRAAQWSVLRPDGKGVTFFGSEVLKEVSSKGFPHDQWVEASTLETDPAVLSRLTNVVREVLAQYIDTNTDRLGNGLFKVLGGPGSMSQPTVAEFATFLIKPATLLGADRTAELLVGWARGEPLLYEEHAVVEGVRIDEPIELETGVRFYNFPRSSAEIPVYLSTLLRGMGWPGLPLGGVGICVPLDVQPAFYKPTGSVEQTWAWEIRTPLGRRDVPRPSFFASLSLACNHYVEWSVTWCDYGDLAYFSHSPARDRYARLVRRNIPPPLTTVDLIRSMVEAAIAIHRVRYARRDLDTAIGRWIESKRRPRFADRLIELRIALELLYVLDERGGIASRIATRAAWHLAPDDAGERRRIYDQVKLLYKRASRAVHGKDVRETADAHGVLSVAQDRCREALLLILDGTDPPSDWVNLILGIPST